MAMNDLMLAKHGTNGTAVPSILQNKLRLLVDADEFAQAEEAAEQYLPLIATRRDSILRYMTHQEALATKRVFWSYCRALAGQKKPEKLAGFVGRSCSTTRRSWTSASTIPPPGGSTTSWCGR